MKYLKYMNEVTVYHNLNGDDKYEISKLKRDDRHKYAYCDGILYELYSEDDFIVSVGEIEHTEENLFYEDQIERYMQYFKDGGGTQSFPVSESAYKDCYNLEEMLNYLDDNGDLKVDLLIPEFEKLYDMDFYDLIENYDEYGFASFKNNNGKEYSPFQFIKDIKDLDEYYYDDSENDDDDKFDKDIYDGLKVILDFWDENKQYNLTDLNHRFAALVRLGKKEVYIDPS